MKFSDALEQYLDHRATAPDESDGYTDKAFWVERQRLLDQLDNFALTKIKLARELGRIDGLAAAEEVARENSINGGNGDGEIYIAKKIADEIGKLRNAS